MFGQRRVDSTRRFVDRKTLFLWCPHVTLPLSIYKASPCLFLRITFSFPHLHPLPQQPQLSVTMSGKSSGKAKSGGKASAGDSVKGQSRSAKAGLQFPVGRVHRLLKRGNYAQRVGAGAPGMSHNSTVVDFF